VCLTCSPPSQLFCLCWDATNDTCEGWLDATDPFYDFPSKVSAAVAEMPAKATAIVTATVSERLAALPDWPAAESVPNLPELDFETFVTCGGEFCGNIWKKFAPHVEPPAPPVETPTSECEANNCDVPAMAPSFETASSLYFTVQLPRFYRYVRTGLLSQTALEITMLIGVVFAFWLLDQVAKRVSTQDSVKRRRLTPRERTRRRLARGFREDLPVCGYTYAPTLLVIEEVPTNPSRGRSCCQRRTRKHRPCCGENAEPCDCRAKCCCLLSTS
jgi:hypothetical protein